MFLNQFGINQAPAPIQSYNDPRQDRQWNQQRMITPQGVQQDPGQMAMPQMSATAPGTPPANAVGMPPGWSTPPFNPNGAPAAPAATPAPVAGAPAPAGVPNQPATTEPLTIDQEGNIVPENTDPTAQPGTFKLREGVTRGDRFRAGFMMLSASGQPQFARVAGALNAGLEQKQLDADNYNQQLLALTRTRTEEGEADGKIIRKIYRPSYEYDAAAGVVREIPGRANEGPQIEEWTVNGWKPYAPGNSNEDREMYKDARSLQRWVDTNELVNPEEGARLDRDVARGGLTPKDAQAQFQAQTAVLQDMKKNYNILQRTLYDTENPFSDVATLFSFMKTADPGSVVRPSEAEMFSGAGSYGTIAANFMNKIISGQSLTDMQQMQLAQVVDQLMMGQIDDVRAARQSWEDYFNMPDQVADGWSTDILNPVDPLYGTSMADDVAGRINSGIYNIDRSVVGKDDDDLSPEEIAIAAEAARKAQIENQQAGGMPWVR